MDSISSPGQLQTFLDQDKENARASSLYILEEDLPIYAGQVHRLLERGYNLQLHSEAKPAMVYSNR